MLEKEFSRDSPLPLYYQICQILRGELAQGNYPLGSSLPSESELIKRFQVSRTTVRKALDELALEGLIHRAQGRGTFVLGFRIEQELTALTGFVEDMLELGYRPSARVVKVEQTLAEGHVAKMLDLDPGAPVTYIERIRLANDEPISFDVTWLPQALGDRVAKENLALYPIYSLLEDKIGVLLDRATYQIESALAMDEVARVLEIEPGSPIFLIERTAYSIEGKPVDYEKLHYRGDRIRFSMMLNRKRPPWRLEALAPNRASAPAAPGDRPRSDPTAPIRERGQTYER